MRALALALLLVGCSGVARQSTGSGWTDERCQRLLDQRDASLWGAAFAGGLGGVGGLATAFPDDDSREARLGLGISSAVLAAAGTSLAMLGRMKSEEFEQWCNVDAPELRADGAGSEEPDAASPLDAPMELWEADGGVDATPPPE